MPCECKAVFRYMLPFLFLFPPVEAPSEALPLGAPRPVPLGIENVGTTVVGRLDGRAVFVTQGYLTRGDERYVSLECIDTEGERVWRFVDNEPGNVHGEYIQWLDLPELKEPVILWSFFPPAHGGEGVGNRGGLFRASDGTKFRGFPEGSNNASFPADLDGDGENELIYCGQRFVTRYELDATLAWRVRDGVLFCWGYPTVVDVLGGGGRAVVWGSEYNLPDGKTSSMVAVDAAGDELWRYDGIDEDLGSTPLFVGDTDGDGTRELIKNGLDLCAANGLAQNHLYVFSVTGTLLRRVPSRMYSTGLADLDGDGHLEAFGVVSHRDGGTEARKVKQLRCIDLASGDLEWAVPVDRVGHPAANALAADLTGDGRLEAIIADGNPVFYGHQPGGDWGAVYVVSAEGRLLQTVALPSWARRMVACDIDDDGKNELVVQVDGRPASLYVMETNAPATARDWPLPFGDLRHWGREHLTSE